MKKLLSVLLALMLVLSLTLVTAVVSAAPGGSIKFESTGTGIAKWSADAFHAGKYSAFLSVVGGLVSSEAKVLIPYGDTLSSINSISFWTNIKTLAASETMLAEAGRVYWADGVAKEGGPGPYIVLELDKNDDGDADDWLVLWSYGESRTSEWVQRSLTEGFHTSWGGGYGVDGVTGQNYWHSVTSDSLATWTLPIPEAYAALKLGTLADWQGTALGDAKVLKVKIDIGCWTLAPLMEAYVDDITINGVLYELEPSSEADVIVDIPSMVAISVTPTSIDFGTLYPGDSSEVTTLTVENIGTTTVDVDARVDPTPTVFDNLLVGGKAVPTTELIVGLVGGTTADPVTIQLVVPLGYSAKGVETATLVFEVKAQ